jgi:hypothetical protein
MSNIEFDSRFLSTMQSRMDAQESSKGFLIPHGLSRQDWVNAQLTRTFIANSATALVAILLAVPLVFATLYGFLPTRLLLVWVALVIAVSAYRWWIVKSYRRRYAISQAHILNAFFMRHAWSWPMSAMLWSGLSFFYLYRVPVENQFLCSLIMVGMGAAAAGLMSAHLRVCLLYLDGLYSLSFAAVLVHMVTIERSDITSQNVTMVLLVLLYWVLMRHMSKRFHTVQRRGYELQFDNDELITSLRERTQAAMDAVQVKNRLLANATHIAGH